MTLEECILEAIEQVKGKKISKNEFDLYVGKNFGIDSIGVVDFWFELKKLRKHSIGLNDFFNYLKSQSRDEVGNDFTLSELKIFLEKN